MTGPREQFDHPYYERYYLDPRTRAHGLKELQPLVDHVLAYLAYLEIPVRTALDIGCGVGMWRDALRKRVRKLDYTGTETSEYLCRKFGWKCVCMSDLRSRSKYDLVVCQSVLQYVPERVVRAGLAAMARLCRGALYLEVLTREDWEENCDHDATDGQVHLRSAAWYRREIRKHFRNAGGGVFLPNGSGTVLYELEGTG